MASFVDNLFASGKSLVKVALQSRHSSVKKVVSGGHIVVMGNGPSLNDTIENHRALLEKWPTMAVNFAAGAPVFVELKPRFYVLADPHFFIAEGSDANVDRLWSVLRTVAWPMTLYVPVRYRKLACRRLGGASVQVEGFNGIGVEGFKCFSHLAYRKGLGMPRPRNVLIPAVMLAMEAGFDDIVVVGADHSWMKTLSVTDDNEVVSVQPHFYKEDSREEERVRHEYRGYALHTIVESFAVAFRSYMQIRDYADSRGVTIVNATPGSFIDAFVRRRPEDIVKDGRGQ